MNILDDTVFGTDPSRDLRFREAALHGTPGFPMRIYENDFSWYSNNIIDWHWHPEIEIAAVLDGRVTCYINDTAVEVGEGEGFIINSNIMHMEKPASMDQSPHMITICFMPEFIGDCGGDLISSRYIQPIVTNSAFKGMKLSDSISWQSGILAALKELFGISLSREWGYELRCRNIISELWYKLAVNLSFEKQESTPLHSNSLSESRLKDMLSFIHENYRSELTVDEIARSANISKSECFRCFRNIIGKQPVTYLIEYRLKAAAELLISTDMQITEVCFACGFNHISYFGKIFHQYYGVTPKQFRKNERVNQ